MHELYESDEVRDAVVERFGETVARDGAIDRAALADLAFAADEDRDWLERLIWPRVGSRIATWREELDGVRHPPKAAVVEVPLLFEAGMQAGFDATIAVIAEEDVRAQRAGERGHQALEQRSARQLSQQEKAHRATYVVVNDGSVDELEHKLSEILGKLHT